MDLKFRTYLSRTFGDNRLLILGWFGSVLLMAMILWLEQLPQTPSWLYFIFSTCALVIYLGFYAKRLHTIKHLLQSDHFDPSLYPKDLVSFAKKMESLQNEIYRVTTASKIEKEDLLDYFMLWTHQIKIPLSALQLQLELPSLDRKALQDSEKRISICVDQAMAYIRMDVSDYQMEPVDIEKVVRQILRDQASVFIGRGITVETSFDSKKVLCDGKWLALIIQQLLSNALKYSPDHSRILITSRDNQLILEDEGCGIAKEDLPRICEKGFTGSNGHKNVLVSSGMGLYLTDSICKKLNCSLQITNREEKGVRARITFPKEDFIGD